MSAAPVIIRKHEIRPEHRLFTTINDLLIVLAAISHASSLMVDGSTHKTPKPQLRLNARGLGYAFALPLRGPLELALKEKMPTLIEIGITPLADPQAPLPNSKLRTAGLSNVMTRVISPIYIGFYEHYSDWLKANLGAAGNWPPTLNFARVIRNAAAHGKINFTDPRSPGVTWRGFTYGPADNGRVIIGTEFGMGEILALMLEASDELDQIQAPH